MVCPLLKYQNLGEVHFLVSIFRCGSLLGTMKSSTCVFHQCCQICVALKNVRSEIRFWHFFSHGVLCFLFVCMLFVCLFSIAKTTFCSSIESHLKSICVFSFAYRALLLGRFCVAMTELSPHLEKAVMLSEEHVQSKQDSAR